MKTKKLLVAILCAILMSALLGACSAGGGSSNSTSSDSSESSQAPSDSDFGNLKSFECTTFDGKTFSQDDFSDYDLTIVNFWMTTCPPCINELPDLEELRGNLPDNVQIVLVCLDGESAQEDAQSIIDQSGFTGTVMFTGDGDMQDIYQQIVYVPTTLFFDSEGKLVGAPIVGSPTDVVGTYTNQIDTILGDNGKES